MIPKIYWRDEIMLHDNDCDDMADMSNCLKAIQERRRKDAVDALEAAQADCDCLARRDVTTPEEFDKIVRHRIDTCLRVLLEKNQEYSRNGDRLWNFRSAGRCRGKHALEALEGMEVKHTVSIDDMVRDCLEGRRPTVRGIEEKFTDAINYLLLKEALVRECL
jgi:hypothetical protein